MLAVLFGLFAALCWSLHDLLARHFANDVGPYRMAIGTLLAGGLLLAGIVIWNGTILKSDTATLELAVILGVIYGLAVSSLFLAFSLAPVSIVGPATAGYPALVVIWGMIHGLQPTALQWLAMVAIIIGAVVVARTGPADGGVNAVQKGKIPLLIFSCVVAEVFFASSVVLGQKIAEHMGEFETTFLSRFPAALVLIPFVMRETPHVAKISKKAWAGIFAMGAFDVAAVSGINYMVRLPNKEFGSMGISAYGAIATLLAMILLKEKTTVWQWVGIAMICGGVAVLGSL
jgi:drug/metabolite transporter (DMT)-like permease